MPRRCATADSMKNKNRNAWIAILLGFALICACFGMVGAGLTWLVFQEVMVSDAPTDALGSAVGAKTNAPSPAPTEVVLQRTSLTDSAVSADEVERIATTTLPQEDLVELAVRFKGVTPQQAEVSCPTLAPEYQIGATRAFTLSNQDDNEQFRIMAQLEYKTPHVYMWVQTEPSRVRLNQAKLRRAAENFDSVIYPTTRAFFGEEESPGVDCDPRVNVLHATGVGSTVGGYFSSVDAHPRTVRSDSNEGQIFVMHAERGYNGSDPGSETYMSTLAHEFQHMISANNTHATDLWLEEGAAQLAERLNGYGDSVTTVYEFAAQPESQLTTFSGTSAGSNSVHYGSGYLFWSYLYDRFGDEITRKLARATERSEQGILRALSDAGVTNPDTGRPFTFEELFADFAVANYMGRTKIEPDGNRYNYASIDVPPMSTRGNLRQDDYPFTTRDAIAQFGTHYYELRGNRPVAIEFAGSTAVRLLPTDDPDGAYWWSNRGDESNPRLTRALDLTGVSTATLTYRAWYRLEADYDYAYVSVSEDSGLTWQLLSTPSCTTEDPQSANLGCGYNDASGGGKDPEWIEESVDLSPYAGKKVLLRFEMVTDAGLNREGLAIDNIEIPEIGFRDDASEDTGWTAEGWVRVQNTLPQSWQVQLIVIGRDGISRLVRMPLNGNAGRYDLDLGGEARSAVLAISPVTQVTTEPGGYELSIR
jgi:hypothetical protein